jgi:hypothetical protein
MNLKRLPIRFILIPVILVVCSLAGTSSAQFRGKASFFPFRIGSEKSAYEKQLRYVTRADLLDS